MIDSHHSFWKYDAKELPWISGDMDALKHDFLIHEFETDLEFSGVDQVISVQARSSDIENKFLLEQAKLSDDLVTGIIGWAPLTSKGLRLFLDQYIYEPLIKGYREIIEHTPLDEYLENPDFDHGIRELTHRGLTFDLSVSPEQLPAVIDLVDRHPNQSFALNNCGSPEISAGDFPKVWARDIRELARRPHVYCKLSGLASDQKLLSADLQPYFDTLLKAFTPERLMFASDWPRCKVQTSYPEWLNIIDDLIDPLSHDEKSAIRQDTAVSFYKL